MACLLIVTVCFVLNLSIDGGLFPMGSTENSKVPYIPLETMSFRNTVTTSAISVKNALTVFLRTVFF